MNESGVCEHCGQPLPAERPVYAYGEQRTNKTAIAVTIGLHLLLVLAYLVKPKQEDLPLTPPGGVMVMVQTPQAAKPREQAPRPLPKQVTPALPRVEIERLPDTITLPDEKPAETPPEKPQVEITPEMDMAAYVAARKKQRGAREETPSEGENEKAMRNIKANIARANAASRDDGGGGIFSISNKTFNSAVVKFNGWNQTFKRNTLRQETVEVGKERDIETAIVKKMIEIIRKEKSGDFEWESHRLNRNVTLSARPQDTEALMAFLYKEMFRDYTPPRE
ncbi:hypothetical protein [Pseudoduganella sp. GCM10020061]|uniref:hypothetical protein n=1 Tax=Pseudoduganella sp. GCM10020061 TaxID=3317345 RepID=UPI00363253AF